MVQYKYFFSHAANATRFVVKHSFDSFGFCSFCFNSSLIFSIIEAIVALLGPAVAITSKRLGLVALAVGSLDAEEGVDVGVVAFAVGSFGDCDKSRALF